MKVWTKNSEKKADETKMLDDETKADAKMKYATMLFLWFTRTVFVKPKQLKLISAYNTFRPNFDG